MTVKAPAIMETIVLGGGCFWCLDAVYRRVQGVTNVVSGYAGGHTPKPDYWRVASKTTGHAEVVQVTFDPKVISLRDLLDIFWTVHDPTVKDRQGYDVGPEYRSLILYRGEEQKRVAEASLKAAQELFDAPIVTEVKPTSISVRFDKLGAKSNEQGFTIYDRSWNVVEALPWRFSPHDGTGIQAPLEIGKTWPVQTNNINGADGSVWKRSGISKVIGQESVTTKAGTFDTFKIETTFTGTNVKNPTVKNEVTSLTWYAPEIDHWVRRTFVSRTNKHLRIDNVIELISHGRKQ